MSYEVLIVDDELEARSGLRESLVGDKELHLLEGKNGLEGIEVLNSRKIDILLLDIQMPEINGFEVLASVNTDKIPTVIFVTAYDKFALRAFDYHALDYILKPYKEERLFEAIDRAKNIVSHHQNENLKLLQKLIDEVKIAGKNEKSDLIWERSDRIGLHERVAVKSNGIVNFFSLSDVTIFEAFGAYVKIHLKTGATLLANSTLKSIMSSCDPNYFYQIHRSFVINVLEVDTIHPGINGDYIAYMLNGHEVRGSRNYRQAIEEILINAKLGTK
ncbi:MAG: LytTR family DNA-binding domain-containing protein [Cyclobacteriaceae bacterium]